MVSIFQKQPNGSLRGPIDWYLFLGWEGEPVTSNPILKPIRFADPVIPYSPQTPNAPSLSAVLTSRTTVTLTWSPASGTTQPAVALWEVDLQTSTDNGASYSAYAPVAGSPFAANILSAAYTGLTAGTPEVKFRYRLRGVNGDGPSPYSVFEVQWAGTIVNIPANPSGLVASNITFTTVDLSWIASYNWATDGATKYGIWSGSTDLNVAIDPSATSFRWSGLTQNTLYNNINIRRFNSAGWSGGTNWVKITTPHFRATVDDPVMGQAYPLPATNPYRTSSQGVRVYNSGDMIPAFNEFNPRVIGYTDDPFSNEAAASMTFVDHVKTMLDSFNSNSARRQCEVHVAYGNEADIGITGTVSQAYINVYAALRQLIWGTTGGVRDYPNASLWVDMTEFKISTNAAGTRFKPIAQYLDGMACSMYPEGRTISATNPLIEYDTSGYPAGSLWAGLPRNNYRFYIDDVFAVISDWRKTGGPGGVSIANQLNQFATWEIGIPIHHSLSGTSAPWVRGGTVDVATDITQRPRYLVGGARVTGPANEQYNFEGYLNYVLKKCDAEDISMREQLYWNEQSNPAIPNKWQADSGLTSPDSVTAWHSWYPGYRIPDF